MMTRTILEKLPHIFVSLVPVFWIGTFLVGGTPLAGVQTLTMYPVYAAFVTALLAGLYLLYRRDPDGMASVLFVLFFYEMLFFALTLWGISAIIIIQALYPELADSLVLSRLARAFVGSSAGGTAIAVVAFYGALRSRCLGHHIPLFPWSRAKPGRDKRVK